MIDRGTPGRELSADRTGHNGRNDSARNALLMLRIPGDDGQGVNGGRRAFHRIRAGTTTFNWLKSLRKPSENVSGDLHDGRVITT